MLFKDRELLYVGKSVDAYGRIDTHRVNGREFDCAIVAGCLEHDIGWIETALIKALETRHNRTHQPAPLPEAAPRRQLREPPPKPDAELPSDPTKILTLPSAERIARGWHLHSKVRPAVAGGELPFIYLTDKRGTGAPRGVRAGELKNWLEARSAALSAI